MARAGVVGEEVAIIALLGRLDDRIATASLAGGTIGRGFARAPTTRTLADQLADGDTARAGPPAERAHVAALERRVDDAVAAKVGGDPQRLDGLAAEPGGAAVEIDVDRADRGGAERSDVAQQVPRRLMGRQGGLTRSAEDQRVVPEELERRQVPREAAGSAPVDGARIEVQRVVARRDRSPEAVGGRVAAEDVLVAEDHSPEGRARGK